MRPRLAALALASLPFVALPFVASPPVALAANIALPSVNPGVRPAGTTTFGPATALGFLNDGVDGATTGASIFQVPGPGIVGIPGGSRGFGYDLGGVAVIESLDLSQFTGESPLGPRARLADVVVHTAAGAFPFSLPDQDDHTLTLPSPVATSWVSIEPVSQHGGGDPQVGIDELAVNSAAGKVLPLRTNVARGAAFTLQGGGWNNVRGSLTDDTLAGSNFDLTTASFNSSPTGAGVSIDLDLGQSFLVSSLGLAENDYGGAGGRTLVSNATLEFASDPSFSDVTATRTLTLANVPYQQVDFDAALGQYVRLTFQGVYPNNDANLGFTEVQLFTVVPEPGALGLIGMSAVAALRRRR
jgi:hypothetical protein